MPTKLFIAFTAFASATAFAHMTDVPVITDYIEMFKIGLKQGDKL